VSDLVCQDGELVVNAVVSYLLNASVNQLI